MSRKFLNALSWSLTLTIASACGAPSDDAKSRKSQKVVAQATESAAAETEDEDPVLQVEELDDLGCDTCSAQLGLADMFAASYVTDIRGVELPRGSRDAAAGFVVSDAGAATLVTAASGQAVTKMTISMHAVDRSKPWAFRARVSPPTGDLTCSKRAELWIGIVGDARLGTNEPAYAYLRTIPAGAGALDVEVPLGAWTLRKNLQLVLEARAGAGVACRSVTLETPRLESRGMIPKLSIAQPHLASSMSPQTRDQILDQMQALGVRELRIAPEGGMDPLKSLFVAMKLRNMSLILNANPSSDPQWGDYKPAAYRDGFDVNGRMVKVALNDSADFFNRCKWHGGSPALSLVDPAKFAANVDRQLAAVKDSGVDLRAVEVGNEADISCFNGDIPFDTTRIDAAVIKTSFATYAQLLKVAHGKVKAQFPSAQVLTFGFADVYGHHEEPAGTWKMGRWKHPSLEPQAILAAIATAIPGENALELYADGIGLHVYPGIEQHETATLAAFARLRAVTRKPFWVTEWGLPETAAWSSGKGRLDAFRSMMTLFAAQGDVAGASFYAWRDESFPRHDLVEENVDGSYADRADLVSDALFVSEYAQPEAEVTVPMLAPLVRDEAPPPAITGGATASDGMIAVAPAPMAPAPAPMAPAPTPAPMAPAPIAPAPAAPAPAPVPAPMTPAPATPPPLTLGNSLGQRSDFDGDRRSGLVATGATGFAIRTMNKFAVVAVGADVALPAGWSYVGTGNFNGDGKADLLLQKGQELAVWIVSGTSVTSKGASLVMEQGWSVGTITDTDGDGRVDIVLSGSGTIKVWRMAGQQVAQAGAALTFDAAWSLTSNSGDFDGDGKGDLVFRRGQTLLVWLMNGVAIKSTGPGLQLAAGTRLAAAGDTDGDGKADLITQSATGFAVWKMNGANVATSGVGPEVLVTSGWYVVNTGDYDCDGKSDLLFQNATSVAIWTMAGFGATGGAGVTNLPTAWGIH